LAHLRSGNLARAWSPFVELCRMHSGAATGAHSSAR
jgi:hypothetical protein